MIIETSVQHQKTRYAIDDLNILKVSLVIISGVARLSVNLSKAQINADFFILDVNSIWKARLDAYVNNKMYTSKAVSELPFINKGPA